ncbi:MAG TPA: M28 family peptidase [Candidatus Limnocylindria bacterium]|nr:M28 family peptidase [Candidatus Limnocylindria bacterium]
MAAPRSTGRPIAIAVLAVLLAGSSLAPATIGANPTSEIQQTQGFRKGVTLAGIREHQAAFQGFADANGGSRVAGLGGYDDSAQYVYDRALAAGYEVSFQEFEFLFVGDASPPVFERLTAPATDYVDGVDFATISYSGSGDVTAELSAVDLVVPSPEPNASTSGCEASDFAGFVAGNIALLQRGTCTFRLKTENAIAAGAIAVVVFNEGNPGRTALNFGTMNPPPLDLPAITTSFAVGDSLRNGVLNGPTGVEVHLLSDQLAEVRTTRNVIAETPDGDPNRVVIIGAHLDSVPAGPGINDNGSGSGTILEIAETFAAQGREPRNKLRFMWYSAEESGLIGSEFYVDSLSPAERGQIEMMLNFDMVGSPNMVRFVYDGDNSAFPVTPGQVQAGPPGSGEIERVFADYFASQGLASEPTPFSGRSDYGPFISATPGIPAGGLFTGAEGLKTAAQALTYGGVAGQQYDPCYHLACDTFAGSGGGTVGGVGLIGLDQMSDAAAHAVLLFSKRNFDHEPLTATSLSADASLRQFSVGDAADAPAPASDYRLDR